MPLLFSAGYAASNQYLLYLPVHTHTHTRLTALCPGLCPSVLLCCWLGGRKGIRPAKSSPGQRAIKRVCVCVCVCVLSGSTWVSQYQKGKTNLDLTEARDSEWQWHQLEHMQVCTSLQTDNHASTPPLSFYRPDALPAAQPTAKKHCWSAGTVFRK